MLRAETKNTKLKTYNNATVRQLGTCYLTLMHKEKQKVCKAFIVPGSGMALLGMLNVETLGVLIIKIKQ